MNDFDVYIWTDGSCRGNPGPGGWGAVLRAKNGREKHISGGEASVTTNNRMELMAVIMALEALKMPCRVSLTSDSQYVVQGAQTWMNNWKKNQWRDVKNSDLWQRIDVLREKHTIIWIWVRGHMGHPENELADRLANQGVDNVLGLA